MVLTLGLHGRLVDDRCREHRDVLEESPDRAVQVHLHGLVVDDVDALDPDAEAGDVHVDRRICETHQRELDVGSRHRVAVGEHRVVADVERPRQAVGAGTPFVRQTRPDIREGVGIGFHERVEDLDPHEDGTVVGHPHRVEGLRLEEPGKRKRAAGLRAGRSFGCRGCCGVRRGLGRGFGRRRGRGLSGFGGRGHGRCGFLDVVGAARGGYQNRHRRKHCEPPPEARTLRSHWDLLPATPLAFRKSASSPGVDTGHRSTPCFSLPAGNFTSLPTAGGRYDFAA